MEDIQALGKRLTTNYALIQSIYNMGYCCVVSFASVFLLARGFTNSEVGLTLTIGYGLAILSQPIVAAFADKTKKLALRDIVVVMLVVTTILSFLLLITPSLVLPTAMLYILLLCVQNTQQSLITAMSMEHINTGVPLNFSLARGIGSFAFAILSLFMGFLVDDYGAWVILPINIGLGVLGIGLVATFRKANQRQAARPDGEKRAAGLIEFGKQNKRFMAVIFSLALLFFSQVLTNTYTIQIVQNVGGSSSDMGIATAIAGFLELPAMALFPLLLARIRSAGTIMRLSGVFFVVKSLITLMAPTMFWINVAQCFQFFSFGLFVPASVFYVNQVIDEVDKVKGQAYMGMAIGISSIIGNFSGGLMLDTSGGVRLMLTVGIGVSIVGLIMLLGIEGWRIGQRQALRE